MNEEMRQFLAEFIRQYREASDKEAFMSAWESLVTTPSEPLTIADAMDAVYGEAIAQVLANEEELYG